MMIFCEWLVEGVKIFDALVFLSIATLRTSRSLHIFIVLFSHTSNRFLNPSTSSSVKRMLCYDVSIVDVFLYSALILAQVPENLSRNKFHPL